MARQRHRESWRGISHSSGKSVKSTTKPQWVKLKNPETKTIERERERERDNFVINGGGVGLGCFRRGGSVLSFFNGVLYYFFVEKLLCNTKASSSTKH